MTWWMTLFLGLATAGTSTMVRTSVPEPGSLDCETLDPCADVLPGAVRFAQVEGKPYVVGLDADEAPVGWVVLSNDVTDLKAYSGKPLSTIVGLDGDGVITGGRVVHHSEPILLVGIPEQALHTFVDAYAGVPADAHVVVGSSDDAEYQVDGVSGATVTVLAQNQTILEAARALAQDVGVLEATAVRPGAFVTDVAPWTWSQMVRQGALGHLVVQPEELGATGDEPYVDLWFGVADAAHVGIPLLGERTWQHAVDSLEEGEHLFVAFNGGSYSFKGSGFVRGGVFDRFRLEQGLHTQAFRDVDYENIGAPKVADAPYLPEGGLFITRDASVDPGEAYNLVFLASHYVTGRGAFARDFVSYNVRHQVPSSVYVAEGLSAEWKIVQAAWSSRPWRTAVVAAWLALVTGLFVSRKWLTADTPRLMNVHVGVMLGAFLGLGMGLGVQPSITQLLTIIGSVAGEWRWSLFLSDPALFLSWVFIAGVLFIWGRGVFCGWTCPYGAMSELQFKFARWLGVPELLLPDHIHKPLRLMRYVVLAGLVVAYLYDASLGERLAEVEPFKSTFYVAPWTRHPGLFAWWSLLFLTNFVTWRPFCQYVCPLGGALAIPSYVRMSGPRRREFCSKCKICTRTCEPRAIDKNGVINGADCLNCMECEANYRDNQVCPPLVKIRRDGERAAVRAAAKELASGVVTAEAQ